MALVEASKILRKHLNPFVQYFDLGQELADERLPTDGAPPRLPKAAAVTGAGGEDLNASSRCPISTLDLSVRASNCLESEGIQTVGDLVSQDRGRAAEAQELRAHVAQRGEEELQAMDLSFGLDPATALGENKA